MKRSILWLILLFFLPAAPAMSYERVLNVYGPGGPLGPMKECGEIFSKAEGVPVHITAGPSHQWIEKARENGDIIFGGAEYMLTDFTRTYPGIVDEMMRTSLYARSAGIVVRKGNPKEITSLEDLTKKGIRIIDVNGAGQVGLWEDLAGRKGLIPGIRQNIVLSVATSAEAIERWKTDGTFDAWITFSSWHNRLKDVTDIVTLPRDDRLYRGTPVAVTKRSQNRELAQRFIAFLKSDEGHRIFQKWGWE